MSRLSDLTRRSMMDDLGEAATQYRSTVYKTGLSRERTALSGRVIAGLLDMALAYCEQTLRANRRADDLYHAYNTLRIDGQGAAVENLYLMLEGQVAVLSSGFLEPYDCVTLLKSLRASDLYRSDQDSYMLYPNRSLPRFRQKNTITADRAGGLELVALLLDAMDARLLILDEAASALDAESERLVQETIEKLRGGRTILVVAHRLSTIRKADRIYVLEEGKVLESGTQEELIALDGRFRQLHDMQFRP